MNTNATSPNPSPAEAVFARLTHVSPAAADRLVHVLHHVPPVPVGAVAPPLVVTVKRVKAAQAASAAALVSYMSDPDALVDLLARDRRSTVIAAVASHPLTPVACRVEAFDRLGWEAAEAAAVHVGRAAAAGTVTDVVTFVRSCRTDVPVLFRGLAEHLHRRGLLFDVLAVASRWRECAPLVGEAFRLALHGTVDMELLIGAVGGTRLRRAVPAPCMYFPLPSAATLRCLARHDLLGLVLEYLSDRYGNPYDCFEDTTEDMAALRAAPGFVEDMEPCLSRLACGSDQALAYHAVRFATASGVPLASFSPSVWAECDGASDELWGQLSWSQRRQALKDLLALSGSSKRLVLNLEHFDELLCQAAASVPDVAVPCAPAGAGPGDDGADEFVVDLARLFVRRFGDVASSRTRWVARWEMSLSWPLLLATLRVRDRVELDQEALVSGATGLLYRTRHASSAEFVQVVQTLPQLLEPWLTGELPDAPTPTAELLGEVTVGVDVPVDGQGLWEALAVVVSASGRPERFLDHGALLVVLRSAPDLHPVVWDCFGSAVIAAVKGLGADVPEVWELVLTKLGSWPGSLRSLVDTSRAIRAAA